MTNADTTGAEPQAHRARFPGWAIAPAIGLLWCAAFVQASKWNTEEPVVGGELPAKTHFSYANCLLAIGQPDKAMAEYQRVLALYPQHAEAHNNLGNLLAQSGHAAEALGHYRRSVELKPDYVDALSNLGNALTNAGFAAEARKHLEAALKLSPDNLSALNNLAWLLATSADDHLRDEAAAVKLAEHANDLTAGNHPTVLLTLAAAYANAGRYADAIALAERVRDAALAMGNEALANKASNQHQMYSTNNPLRLGGTAVP